MTVTVPDTWTTADRAVVRRTRRRVGLVVALAVSALVTLIGGIAYGMLVRGQEDQIQRHLAYDVAYGDTDHPAGCSWIFIVEQGALTAGNAPAPPGFPRWDQLTAVAADGTTRLSTVERDGTTYFVRTGPRGHATVQAVFDARYQLADRRHLLFALALAAAVGLLAAGGLGLLVSRRTVAPLAEALTRQRRFVADASHELRTPLTQLHTRAQMLARRARHGGADTHTDLERLVGTSRLLGEIVDDLLLSARLSAAPIDHRSLGLIDLSAAAEAALAGESERSRERGVTMTLTRPDSTLHVPGVPSALRRVIVELLANALTHTPAGGRIEVTVRRLDDDRAELVVADTGEGFDPADARKLFDRFHRGATTGDRQFGLGLSLLHEVVTSHGGTIDAEGRPGHGATFTVRLPTGHTPRPTRPRRPFQRCGRPRETVRSAPDSRSVPHTIHQPSSP